MVHTPALSALILIYLFIYFLCPPFNLLGNQNKIHFSERVLDQSFHTDIFVFQTEPSPLGHAQRRVLKVMTQAAVMKTFAEAKDTAQHSFSSSVQSGH